MIFLGANIDFEYSEVLTTKNPQEIRERRQSWIEGGTARAFHAGKATDFMANFEMRPHQALGDLGMSLLGCLYFMVLGPPVFNVRSI